jgi:hypothetical protein
MKRFSDFVSLKEDSEFPDPTRLAGSSGKEGCLTKLVRLAWDRYEPETKDFFRQLANKDPDIKDTLSKMDNEDDLDMANRGQRDKDDQDVIAPPEADTSPGVEGD